MPALVVEMGVGMRLTPVYTEQLITGLLNVWQGLGVLVASSELPELIGLCDRIVVLRAGRNVAAFSGAVDEHTVLAAVNGRVA